MAGNDLASYLSDFGAQPYGDRWVLEFGYGVRYRARLVLVYLGAFMNYAVILVDFPTGPKYLRLDRYHERHYLAERIYLRYWNQTDWHDCLDEVASPTSDGSQWTLHVDAVQAEDASENDRQIMYKALYACKKDDTVLSHQLLAVWYRL
ncbi:hypothetical protein DACRYDRAFT_21042, partial [Dacryopinax primogenitus]